MSGTDKPKISQKFIQIIEDLEAGKAKGVLEGLKKIPPALLKWFLERGNEADLRLVLDHNATTDEQRVEIEARLNEITNSAEIAEGLNERRESISEDVGGLLKGVDESVSPPIDLGVEAKSDLLTETTELLSEIESESDQASKILEYVAGLDGEVNDETKVKLGEKLFSLARKIGKTNLDESIQIFEFLADNFNGKGREFVLINLGQAYVKQDRLVLGWLTLRDAAEVSDNKQIELAHKATVAKMKERIDLLAAQISEVEDKAIARELLEEVFENKASKLKDLDDYEGIVNLVRALFDSKEIKEASTTVIDYYVEALEAIADRAMADEDYPRAYAYDEILSLRPEATQVVPKCEALWVHEMELCLRLNQPINAADYCINLVRLAEQYPTLVDKGKYKAKLDEIYELRDKVDGEEPVVESTELVEQAEADITSDSTVVGGEAETVSESSESNDGEIPLKQKLELLLANDNFEAATQLLGREISRNPGKQALVKVRHQVIGKFVTHLRAEGKLEEALKWLNELPIEAPGVANQINEVKEAIARASLAVDETEVPSTSLAGVAKYSAADFEASGLSGVASDHRAAADQARALGRIPGSPEAVEALYSISEAPDDYLDDLKDDWFDYDPADLDYGVESIEPEAEGEEDDIPAVYKPKRGIRGFWNRFKGWIGAGVVALGLTGGAVVMKGDNDSEDNVPTEVDIDDNADRQGSGDIVVEPPQLDEQPTAVDELSEEDRLLLEQYRQTWENE
jgi:hypothetical protein